MHVPADSLSVQFGCGSHAPDTWLNFDCSPSMRIAKIPGLRAVFNLSVWSNRVRFGDIVQGLPVPDGSCRRLFCDQVLEHLSRADCARALQNCHKILKEDGVFRLFVPDLASIVRMYTSEQGDDAAHRFIETLGMGERERARGMKGLFRNWLGNSRHRWMWDEASMTQALNEAGFGSVRRVVYQDSGDPLFDELEGFHPEWKDGVLGLEAKRHVSA
jgi:hypothetical protein